MLENTEQIHTLQEAMDILIRYKVVKQRTRKDIYIMDDQEYDARGLIKLAFGLNRKIQRLLFAPPAGSVPVGVSLSGGVKIAVEGGDAC